MQQHYRQILSEINDRVNDQYLNNNELSLDDALEGFDLSPEERSIMEDFAAGTYHGIKIENEEESRFLEKIKPYKTKAIVLAIGGGAVSLSLLVALATKSLFASLIGAYIGSNVGGRAELDYRPISSFLAKVKRRTKGEAFDPEILVDSTLSSLLKYKKVN